MVDIRLTNIYIYVYMFFQIIQWFFLPPPLPGALQPPSQGSLPGFRGEAAPHAARDAAAIAAPDVGRGSGEAVHGVGADVATLATGKGTRTEAVSQVGMARLDYYIFRYIYICKLFIYIYIYTGDICIAREFVGSMMKYSSWMGLHTVFIYSYIQGAPL